MRSPFALLASALPLSGSDRPVQLLPAGRFKARDGRPGRDRFWTVTDVQGHALAADMNAVTAQTEIVFDYDHQTMNVDKTGAKAPAAGWIKRVEWLDGKGLFATVDWTAAARAHIDAKEYRYVSPVFSFDKDSGVVNSVAMASLVNFPGLLGMEPVIAALSAFSVDDQEPQMNETLAALTALLGLAAGTDEQTALAAVQALKTKADASPKAVLPAALSAALNLADGADETAALSAVQALKDAEGKTDATTLQTIAALQREVAALSGQLRGDKVTRLVDEALSARKLLPAQREWALALGKKDFEALSAFISTAPVMTGLAGQSGDEPRDQQTAALSADASKIKSAFGLSDEQWARGDKSAKAAA